MAHSTKTYEDWLALSDQQRKEVHFKEWNVSGRASKLHALNARSRKIYQST
jgi:hypothetical protein